MSHWSLLLLFVFTPACTSCSGSGPAPADPMAGGASGASVLQYHNNAARTGLYVDPALTRAAAPAFHIDPAFSVALPGPTYAQPLFVERASSGRDAFVVATEQNQVIAVGSDGTDLWRRTLAPPAPLSSLPCGNIDPLGITGTPVVDPQTHTLYLDAMTTPDQGTTKKHLVYALSLQDGAVLSGWPVDVSAALARQGITFSSDLQNQRGGLAFVNGTVYVSYGGHYGDCGDYHGWLIGISATQPDLVRSWSTPGLKAGIWSPVGIASDGSALYAATGNTSGASAWAGGESVFRFLAGPVFEPSPLNFFAPSDWPALDAGDIDIGSAGPVLVDLPGASPEKLILQMGKNGKAYLLDRGNLGGVSAGLVAQTVATGEIISAPALYTTPGGTFVAVKAAGSSCPGDQTGDLLSLRLTPGAPPSLSTAWCAAQNGLGSPIATSSDGLRDAMIWSAGAEGDNRLRAFDGETGAVLFTSPTLASVRRYQTPIAAKGRIIVAADNRLYAFTGAP